MNELLFMPDILLSMTIMSRGNDLQWRSTQVFLRACRIHNCLNLL